MHTLNTLCDFIVHNETIIPYIYISVIQAGCLCESCMAKQLRSYNLLYIATHDFLALIPYTNLYKAKHSYNKHYQYNICYNTYVYIAVPT